MEREPQEFPSYLRAGVLIDSWLPPGSRRRRLATAGLVIIAVEAASAEVREVQRDYIECASEQPKPNESDINHLARCTHDYYKDISDYASGS